MCSASRAVAGRAGGRRSALCLGRGGLASRSRSESRWRLSHPRAGLIRPASSVERGRPERLGRGRLLQDLELGTVWRRGGSRSRSGSCWRLSHSRAGLIRPASSVERGRPERSGCRRLLQDLSLGDGLAVRVAVRRVLRGLVGGRCAARRLDDAATTSSAGRLGVAIGGGLPALGLGHPMTPTRAAHVSLGSPWDFRRCLPSLGRWLHCCRMHTLRAGRSAGRAVSGRLLCVCLRGVFVVPSIRRRYDAASSACLAAAPADDRRCRSARACEARPARSTLPPRSRRARRRRPHHTSPPTAQRVTRTAASASPSPPENIGCCHCPAPDSSDGNTKPRSVPAQATSALDRASSSAP